MDLFMAARYFDSVTFEGYDFTKKDWTKGDFEGQLKRSDDFKTIYHRPTRKRMMFTVPEVTPSSTVIRAKTTKEEFMVGSLQEDVFKDTHYRNTWALNKTLGSAAIIRTAPTGPANNPGFATTSTVETTFVDFELRSLNENEDAHLYPRGHYVGTFPSNSLIDRGDHLTLNGETYWCIEAYDDSALRMARMVNRPSHWTNFVYKVFTGNTYIDGQNVPSYTSYNVTGRFGPDSDTETKMDLNAKKLRIMIPTTWIGVSPKLNDVIVLSGTTYRISKVSADTLEAQWVLEVNI